MKEVAIKNAIGTELWWLDNQMGVNAGILMMIVSCVIIMMELKLLKEIQSVESTAQKNQMEAQWKRDLRLWLWLMALALGYDLGLIINNTAW